MPLSHLPLREAAMTFSDAWIPLLSALVSGVIVKVVDHTYVRREKSFDDAVAIRKELRDEVHSLHRELKALQLELDRWKSRFYDLATRYQELLAECQTLRTELEELREHDDLRGYQQFQRALAEARQSTPPIETEVSHAVETRIQAPRENDALLPPDVG
jgi:predicted nuclease with TOPRIM domain